MIEPKNIKDIDFEFIKEYCVDNGHVDWLKKLAKSKVPNDKNGVKRRISFIEIRNEFTKKFFPALVPVAKPKKKSIYDIIEEL